MKISRMQSWQVLNMLKNGIETEHFKATVIWPHGFDGEPDVRVEMVPCKFTGTDMDSSSDMMFEALYDELRSLKSDVEDLIHEIAIFSLDRDCVRNNTNPGIAGRSCYSNVYRKKCKGECA